MDSDHINVSEEGISLQVCQVVTKEVVRNVKIRLAFIVATMDKIPVLCVFERRLALLTGDATDGRSEFYAVLLGVSSSITRASLESQIRKFFD